MALKLSNVIILLTCVPWLTTTSAELSSQPGSRNPDRFIMSESLEPFVESLDLPSIEAEHLKSTLARSTNASPAHRACAAAQLLLGSDIVNTPPVEQSTVDGSWSEACRLLPACAIQPRSAQHVATALKIIRQFNVPFAVRSGGHSPNPGFSSIQDGILIDLSRLDGITVSDDRATVSVGPGQRWGDVYTALDPYQVSVIGGRMPNIGVGGVILGGGYHHFSAKYGLAADNVKSFEIVLADGTIATADATKNSDLFWALKGAGPNFGIVTNFELYTVPLNKIWYEVLVVSNEDAHAVLDAFVTWQNTSASSDTKGTVGLVMALQYITLGFVYSEPSEKRPATFSAFDAIKPLSVAVPPTNGTVSSLGAILGAMNAPGRHDYRAASTRIDAQLYKDVYDFWLVKAREVNKATGANQTFAVQPAPIGLAEAGNARGGNAMGIPTQDHMWWTTLVDWENAADDETVRSASISTTEKWRELGEERGLHLDFLYTNDASRDQSPIATYGAANVAKLKAIALKYDPDQVFQNLQNDGFLLRKI
ncbi:hypothetical protein KVR01_010271 [Diaporthe batatas]|uniref:uncharacterized protein n=1 Tax=Diaporthe batatas TaxID=748121 RepID=UPI001D04D65F|nr:uncharacterized protein KVR01_010271 [Diaporthe batatas]KAG8159634.1 hypothetical protein KVR01_010271 [Diaporthe batatas]